jgi:hypothetical protein
MYLVMAFRDLLQANAIYDFSECLDLLTGAVPCCKSVENVDVLLKLVDRAAAHIRAFRVDDCNNWILQALAALISVCGTSSIAVVVPTASADAFSPEAVSQKGEPNVDKCSYEERVKRMFLLQLSELRAQLAENRGEQAWGGNDM